MELIEDPLIAKIRSAIGVMRARSKTIDKPYEVSYEQFAKMINHLGKIDKNDIESTLNNNPELAGEISKLRDSSIEVDATATATSDTGDLGSLGSLDDGSTLGVPGPNGEGPDVSGLPPGQDQMGADLGSPGAVEPAAPPGTEGPNQVDIVKQMASRAAKRRMR